MPAVVLANHRIKLKKVKIYENKDLNLTSKVKHGENVKMMVTLIIVTVLGKVLNTDKCAGIQRRLALTRSLVTAGVKKQYK